MFAGIPRRSIVAALFLVLAVASVAWAHTRLVRSSPAPNAHLPRLPAQLRLEFSENVNARTSRVVLVAPDSQRNQLALQVDSADGKVLLAGVPALAFPGEYRVEWRLLGPDGHAVTGQYSFAIDSIATVADTARVMSPAANEEVEAPVDAMSQRIIRFGSMLSLVVVIGGIAFALFVLPATRRPGGGESNFFTRTEGRLRLVVTAGAWSLLVIALARLIIHGAVLSGSLEALRPRDLADILTGTTFGRGWLLQVAATIALIAGMRKKPLSWNILVGPAVALAISAAFLGHPAAVPDARFAAMTLDAAHLLAAGAWAGSILVLASIAIPAAMVDPAAERNDVVRSVLRAFSPLALWCAAVVAVTGSIGGWLQLRALGHLVDSAYGLMLFRKVVVVLLIAGLGAFHWRVLQPVIAAGRSMARLRVSLAFDVALVLVVLVLTALLTGTAPPAR